MNIQYFPVLKAKAGEFWAVSHLDDAAKHVTPIFVAVPPAKDSEVPEKELGQKVVDDIQKHWSRKFYLDLSAVSTKYATASLKQCLDRKLNFSPVVQSQPSEEYLALVSGHLSKSGQAEVMLRCHSMEQPRRIRKLLESLKKEPQQCIYVIDYREKPMDIAEDILDICDPAEWKELIAVSGTFPSRVNQLDQSQWHAFPRESWTSWLSGIRHKNVVRMPAFGDYATRSVTEGNGRGEPSANVRYSVQNGWNIRIGKKLISGGPASMIDICKDLVGRKFYAGREFSMGDMMFDEVAHERGQTGGGALQWVQWSLNHHLVRVARDLQAISEK